MSRSNKSAIFFASTLVAFALLALLASRPSANALANCDTSSAALDSSELAVVGYINDARVQAGLAPLAVSEDLNRAAAWKSEDRSASPPPTIYHQDSLGRQPSERAQDCGYPGGAGENIAWGYSTARSVFNAWMVSPGHQRNILNASYVVVGVGRSGTSWTTDFGLISDGGSVPQPPQAPGATATPTTAASGQAPPAQTPTSPAAPIAPAPNVSETRVQLLPGFNLVTYSGPRQVATEAFDSIGNVELWVYGWNPNAKLWYRFFRPGPDYLNTLLSVEPGQAYMMWVSWSAVWEY